MAQNSSETMPVYVSNLTRLKSRILTGHVNGIGEEISCIRDQDDDAALGLWKSSDMRKLQENGSRHANCEANHQTAKENEYEDSDALK
jgi:hypothetical protein